MTDNDTPAKANQLVWSEIPVTDMAVARRFYEAVLEKKLEEDNNGPNPMLTLPDSLTGASGHLYPGKPAPRGTGNTVHLRIDGNLEDAIERVEKAGGAVVSPIIEIPVGRFFYTEDPDGNSIGFFSYH